MAAFAVPTIFYVTRKQADLATAKTAVQHCLATLRVAPVDHAALVSALAMPGSEFEDNLQIACTVQAGVNWIVQPRDPRGFAHISGPGHDAERPGEPTDLAQPVKGDTARMRLTRSVS